MAKCKLDLRTRIGSGNHGEKTDDRKGNTGHVTRRGASGDRRQALHGGEFSARPDNMAKRETVLRGVSEGGSKWATGPEK